MVMLNEVCELITDGSHFSPKDIGEGFPMLSVKDMGERDFSFSSCKHISKMDYDILVKSGCKPQKGDVLVAKDGSYFKYAFQICEDREIVILSSIAILRPKADVLDAGYLREFLMADSTYSTVSLNYISGTALKRVILQGIKKIQIPLPPLEEQRRIAALLDKVSDLIAKRRAQLDKLDLLVKARFVEMFGDPFINPMAWKKIKIKDAVTVEPQNGMYKPQSDYVTDGSGTPILRIDGFYAGVVTDLSSLKRLLCDDKEKKKYLLKEDDIVINRVNSIEYLGKCAHIKGLIEETVYESNMMRMHFDSARFNPVYVTHLLCSRFVYDQVVNHAKKAVNQASINQKDVLDFDIYQPSIDLQNMFADFVNQVDQSKLAIQQSLDKMETLKKALMQQYFG